MTEFSRSVDDYAPRSDRWQSVLHRPDWPPNTMYSREPAAKSPRARIGSFSMGRQKKHSDSLEAATNGSSLTEQLQTGPFRSKS